MAQQQPGSTQQQPQSSQKPNEGQQEMPPLIRSCLSLGLQLTGLFSFSIRGSPGYVGALLYKGKAYCFACGWRDNTRGGDVEDKGNYLRLRDPVSFQHLTIPATGHLVWQLHKSKAIDMEAPLTQYLPDLPDEFERLNMQDVLSFQVGFHDSDVYQALEIVPPRFLAKNAGPRSFSGVWQPLRKHFGGIEGDKVSPSASRSRFIEFLRSPQGRSIRTFPRLPPGPARRPSHFALCLVAAAIDKVMKKPFEDVMFEKVLDPLQGLTVAYGIPQVIRQSHLFFQPKGIANGHYHAKHTVPAGSIENVAPPLFNASLNMYGLAEDYAKILIETLVSVQNSLEVFPAPSSKVAFHQLGIRVDPAKSSCRLLCPMDGRNLTPFCGSFTFDQKKDCGSFAIANCGSLRAQLCSNAMSVAIGRHFIRQVIDLGIDPFDEEASKGTTQSVQKKVDRGLLSRVLKRDSHTRL